MVHFHKFTLNYDMNKESISLIGDFLYLPVSFVQKDLPSVLVGTYASLRHVKGLNRPSVGPTLFAPLL